MAFNYLVGLPGNGKTYGVLKRVIIPALKGGRTVLTNIEGIDPEKVAVYLGKDVEEIKSLLVVVDKYEPYKEKFWYDEDDPEGCTVRPGYLVVLDEVNRYLGTLANDYNPRKPPEDKYQAVIWPVFEIFCREHRHYVDEKGQSLDVWLLSQGFNDIKRKYHGIIDMTVLTTKLDFLGRPDEFKMFYYVGAVNPMSRGGITQSHFRVEPPGAAGEKFDPEIGKLYHSHRGGYGVEKHTDSNKNFWDQKVLFGLLTLRQGKNAAIGMVIVAAIGAAYSFYNIFKSSKAKPHVSELVKAPVPVSGVLSLSNASMGPGSQLPVLPPPPSPSGSSVPAGKAEVVVPNYARDEDQTITLVGFEQYGPTEVAVLLDKAAKYRYTTEYTKVDAGPASYIVYDGKKVSRWTGPGLITTKKVDTK
jgi:zona occludens toxin